ncbi:hypothetical protein Q9L58_010099, partial [Maublancomyces gigas]
MHPRRKCVSGNPQLLRAFFEQAATTYYTKEAVFALFKEHFHSNCSDINNPEQWLEEIYATYISFCPPSPQTPAAPIPTPTVSSSTAGSLLTGWSPTLPPQTPLSTFEFRPTRGGLSQSSSRPRTKCPIMRSRDSSPSLVPPGPDKMPLSSTNFNTTAEGPTPEACLIAQVASLIAQVASLVELIQALREDLTATQAQVLSLTNALRSRGPAPAPLKPAPTPPSPAPSATNPPSML